MIRFAEADPRIAGQASINPIAVESTDIVAWIERKAPRAIDNWDEIGAEEYARGFTVARTAGHDVVGDLYRGMQTALAEGQDFEDFAELVTPTLRAKGWMADEDDEQLGRRLRTIFDTNLRVSRAVGHWERIQATKRGLPYLRYSAVMDRRTRPGHAVLHGIIRPVDDPFWMQRFPPCSFGCRCIAQPISRSQLQRYGGVTGDARTQTALQASARDAWGYNVGVEHQRALAEKVMRTNAERIPGAPYIDQTQIDAEARAQWAEVMSDVLGELIEKLTGE